MAIYRGPGGSGDTTNDAASLAPLVIQKAADAAASASEAAASAAAAESSANSAAASASSISGSVSAAAGSASSAASSASTATTKASEASTSATNAASSASSAATDASSASSSASAASSSASSASSSASAASSAQTAAESALAATLSAYDSFDDRYLGAKSSDPTLDNDGNALIAGSLYFNTSIGGMKVYTGSAWVAAYMSGAGYLAAASNLSDLVSSSTARTNLGLGTAATTASTDYATAAQGTKADTAYGWGNHASAGYLTTSSAATTYQPLDGDLTAIAALNGSTGLLKKTATNTWSIDTTIYVPTTGTGATGTWSISVSGNAATVTNGLYSTSSYSDPTWLTTLAGSKITGTIDGGTY